jgi:hypothetical protein
MDTENLFGLFTQFKVFFVGIFKSPNCTRGRRGRDRMVVGFTTPCVINAYHY